MSGYPYSRPVPMPRAFAAAERPSERRRDSVATPLVVAALCLLALALVWVLAELVPAIHRGDAQLLLHFLMLDHGRVNTVAAILPVLLNPVLFTLWGIGLVLIAIARDRARVALAVALILALAPLSSELLKPLLAHSHLRAGWIVIGPASYPSGHSTAATILALSAVLVASPRLRPLVAALAVVFSLAVGAALLIRAWHMPSDVLGGYLMAILWAALAVAGVRFSERRWPPKRSRETQLAQG
jgi:membrane-associated phospholipid phosphatase